MVKNKNIIKRGLEKYLLIVLTIFLFILFISFVSAGNYNFQNSSGDTLLFINSTSGNVGIGTACLNAKLVISVTSKGSLISLNYGSDIIIEI